MEVHLIFSELQKTYRLQVYDLWGFGDSSTLTGVRGLERAVMYKKTYLFTVGSVNGWSTSGSGPFWGGGGG